ncbi:MAG: PEP-CTERM sorting domain-containing protein [Akkermansiaceae bacterium]
MKTNKNNIKTLIVTAGLTTFLVGSGSAAVIIEDTFTRNGALNGSAADTGQVWSHPGSTFTTDGSSMQLVSSQVASISGITFLPNCIYRLSMDVSLDTSSNFWIGLGYGTQHVDSTGFMIHEQGNAGLFPTDLTGKQTILLADTNLKNFEVTLQTGASLSSSTTSWKIDGSTVGTAQSVDASGLGGVFVQLSGTGLQGTVDNFKLTHDAVPEPSSALLLGLGGIGLILRRRRVS